MNIDIKQIDNIVIEDLDFSDYPDFTNAYISSADHKGVEMTEEQINWVSDNHPDFVYEAVINSYI